ncbi:hypothetical protein BHM03_00016046 [Ensete ventricosum]|nr:hypothetical protein BHM03_00016046 [Ensete ventricosum]
MTLLVCMVGTLGLPMVIKVTTFVVIKGRVRCSRLVRWGRSRRIRGHAGVPRFANPKEGTVSGLWRFNYGVKDALNCVTFDKRSTSLEDEEE